MIKTFFCAALLLVGWQQARGFALLGPFAGSDATWQIATLGYAMPYIDSEIPGDPVFLGDIGGPKNYSEGYRRNDPVVYYAYDSIFGRFFGAQGETACDQAFAMMNSFFTNNPNGVDGYSSNLTEFPFNSEHFNGTAQAFYLTDLKSVMLHLLVEQMGLAEPERYTWTLRQRFEGPSPPPCPENVQYSIIQRNYGTADQPLTGPETGTIYSPYVNNLLYTYGMLEDCNRHPPAWDAITVPFSTDTTVPEYTAVAANNFEGGAESGLGGLQIGGYYTGLTEDDAAGLRYLMSSNNIDFEIPTAGSQMEVTDTNGAIATIVTSDLAALLEFAQTNPPAALQAAFPTLQITSTNTFLVNIGGTNFINWSYTFGNLVILNQFSNVVEYQQTIVIQPLISGVPGSFQTNVYYQPIVLNNANILGGQYLIIPPGSCGFDIIATNPPTPVPTTNFISTTLSGNGAISTTVNLVTVSTNETLFYHPCQLEAPAPANYQGIQSLQFVRVSDGNVNPLTRTFYTPVTSTYTNVFINRVTLQRQSQAFQRIVTAPDFVITASDQVGANLFVGSVTRNINYEEGQILPGGSGPGVIDGQTTFNFDDIGTVWWNGPFLDTNSFLIGPDSEVNQTTATPSLLWGSFDGSTNAPIVYPTSLSIQELESQMVINILPTSLPAGTNGQVYITTAFSATGGSPNYTWAMSGLPTGLSLIQNVLAGRPHDNTNGVYDVTLQLTDSATPAHIITIPYTININN